MGELLINRRLDTYNPEISIGDVIGIKDSVNNTVDKVENCPDKVPIGISLYNVSLIDNISYIRDEVALRILIRGKIIQRLEYLNLPILQPIFVDLKNSKLTWKKLGPQVGNLISTQDKDGYVNIEFDFTRRT